MPRGIFRVADRACCVAFAAVPAQVQLGGAGLCTAEAGADGIVRGVAGRARGERDSGEFRAVE